MEKQKALGGMAVAVAALMALTGMAASDTSLERGRELFNGSTLGSNGKSCGGCHRDGKGLEKAATYDEGELADIINQCIKKPLEGKGLDPSSGDMKSLINYIRSLASPGRVK